MIFNMTAETLLNITQAVINNYYYYFWQVIKMYELYKSNPSLHTVTADLEEM